MQITIKLLSLRRQHARTFLDPTTGKDILKQLEKTSITHWTKIAIGPKPQRGSQPLRDKPVYVLSANSYSPRVTRTGSLSYTALRVYAA